MSRDPRLTMALRRNAARLALPDYLAEMTALLGRAVTETDLVDLAATCEVVDAMSQRSLTRADYVPERGMLVTEDREHAHRAIRDMWSEQPADAELWLILRDHRPLCGAVRVTPALLLAAGADLVVDDGPDVLVTDPLSGWSVQLYADSCSGHAPMEWLIDRFELDAGASDSVRQTRTD